MRRAVAGRSRRDARVRIGCDFFLATQPSFELGQCRSSRLDWEQPMGFSVGGPATTFSFVALAFVAILLVASWIILAGSRFIQGGVVEHPDRVPQLYGYSVCLIALIAGFASVLSLVENALKLNNPTFHTETPWSGWAEPSVTSFEAFRATYDRARELRGSPNAPALDPLPEEELRRRYEGLRADRIAHGRVAAQRSLITNGLTLLLSLALFGGHWRWLRHRVEATRVRQIPVA
jgi:hypothetical protein